MTIALVALLGAAVLLVLGAVVVRRRARAREARRVEALAYLAERLEASLEDLRPPTFEPVVPALPTGQGDTPLVAGRLPGRAALLDAVASDVARATADGSRLTVARVRAAGATTPEELADAVRDVAGRPAYAVGPAASAFTLPGLGRADGLGTLARVESRVASTGRAVEWRREETAVELVARLLGEQGAGEHA
jgi:type II secretory pathway pseudopilin PulG